MTYLLAKYALVFLLSLISGIFFGRWITRRRFVDVSESYDDLRDAATRSDAGQWNKLWGRLDALPAPKETDYSLLTDRLDGLAYAIGNLPEPSAVNFAPVEGKLDALNKTVRAIPVPAAPKELNLLPITSKLDNLAAKLDKVTTAIQSIPRPEPQRIVDLTSLQSGVASLRNDIKEIPAVETHAAVDISPIREQVSSLGRQVHAISQRPEVDLAPIDQRLGAIEAELGRLGRRLEVVPQAQNAPPEMANAGPATLKTAMYGDKDNLRLIFGVGPMLEDLLNHHGIFYFWQIANWTDGDIDTMDQRLDTFKGRIVRDNWVDQAAQRSREPGSAKQPAQMRISA